MENFGRNDYDLDLGDFNVLWAGFTPILVPSNFTHEEEKYLLASQLTLALGNSSVDNVLKKYLSDFGENESSSEKKSDIIQEVINFAKIECEILIKKLNEISFDDNGTTSDFAADVTFRRLTTTIKSIHFHIKFGYYYESLTLIRLFLEQLAYAFTISQTHVLKSSDIVSPTRSINHLKKVLPTCGKLYGILSKYSHIDISTINKYLTSFEQQPAIIKHSIIYSLESALFYLNVLEYQNIVFEICFKKYLITFSAINYNSKNESFQVNDPNPQFMKLKEHLLETLKNHR
ncbi:hypothetical protein J2X31_000358 [Flavobacterium arsenatis]|uniref:Uncharacterized protein n=1 Tax=Flavobacterium arsenatis TaxID=1484332 RepID=A0ABU1TKA4_9FLAO|nr:hypothetical protein [Flavobacterium arsenatis]MDR6966365.1 hypothetical protein [Flavobacterium arsenatis]